jgi:RHS repeat-associated protein
MLCPADHSLVVYNLRLPGQYADVETGLNYNYFRDYDPGTGRYEESDPLGLKGGDSTYAYADGDPVDESDPLGLRSLTLCELAVLQPYFPQKNLKKINIKTGIPWLARKFGAEGADAWTLWNTIYMAPGVAPVLPHVILLPNAS